MRAMTASGVPRGASSATHAFTSKLAGPPASLTVGTSGKPATRFGAATATNLTFLARYIGPAEAALPNAQATSLFPTAA
jgi:hypothetical protein